MNKRKLALEKAIFRLENLIANNNKDEKSYQQYFETTAIIFEILGYDWHRPFTKGSTFNLPKDNYSDLSPEPDFLVKKITGRYEIFEIKTPFTSPLIIDRNPYRVRPSAEFSSYISQVVTYKKYFDQNSNLENIRNQLNIHIEPPIECSIVIGLDRNRVEVHRQLGEINTRITLYTYDDILRQLEYDLKMLEPSYNLPGISIHWILKIHKQEKKIGYLFDKAIAVDKNRISGFVNDDEFIFRVIDSLGIEHSTKIDFVYDELFYLVCECGIKDDNIYISIFKNGKQLAEHKFKKKIINLIFDRDHNFIIGADVNKENGLHFSLKELFWNDKTSDFRLRFRTEYTIHKKHSVDCYWV